MQLSHCDLFHSLKTDNIRENRLGKLLSTDTCHYYSIHRNWYDNMILRVESESGCGTHQLIRYISYPPRSMTIHNLINQFSILTCYPISNLIIAYLMVPTEKTNASKVLSHTSNL